MHIYNIYLYVYIHIYIYIYIYSINHTFNKYGACMQTAAHTCTHRFFGAHACTFLVIFKDRTFLDRDFMGTSVLTPDIGDFTSFKSFDAQSAPIS